MLAHLLSSMGQAQPRILCTFATGRYWLSFRENWKLYGFQFELDKAENISLKKPFYFTSFLSFEDG